MLSFLLTLLLLCLCLTAQTSASPTSARVRPTGAPAATVSPYLFGSFIELLDDVAPGMWAEMLNDRSFEGIQPSANWCYRTGEPNVCDRPWDSNPSWSYDSTSPFNGSGCAKLLPRKSAPASLAQSGLALNKGMTYLFSGYLRTDGSHIGARVILKTLLPNGKWLELDSHSLPGITDEWGKVTCSMVSTGTTDRAVFELRVAGSDAVYADKLSLMPADNVHGWRSDVIRVIREAHPPMIRWGGSVVDPGGYRWKNGIGDRDTRTPFPNRVWGRIDSNDVGIDEFLQFCEAVKAEPLICVSFSDGAQSARDLVEYCNAQADTPWGAKRAANGHPEPYNVRYWQIGNELGDQNYVEGCPPFVKAIKGADPNAVILASFPSKELVEKVGPSLDYICPHQYTEDLGSCEKQIMDTAALCADTPGCGNIKFGITEWNVSAGDFGLRRGMFLTLSAALKNARYLNLLIRHSDVVRIACRSNICNSQGCGLIQTRPDGVLKPPTYYVMKLYADHAKQRYVSVEGAPSGIDAVACASEDGKSLCVFAVNMNAEPVELSLDLIAYPGLQPAASEVVVDTQDRRQPDLMNHWTAPDRVRTVKLPVESSAVRLPALSAAAIEFKVP